MLVSYPLDSFCEHPVIIITLYLTYPQIYLDVLNHICKDILHLVHILFSSSSCMFVRFAVFSLILLRSDFFNHLFSQRVFEADSFLRTAPLNCSTFARKFISILWILKTISLRACNERSVNLTIPVNVFRKLGKDSTCVVVVVLWQ